MKTALLKVTGSVASVASCLVFFGGVVSAQATSPTGTITDTGEDSVNVIRYNDYCLVKIVNNNYVTIINENTQEAVTGSVNAGGGQGQDPEHEQQSDPVEDHEASTQSTETQTGGSNGGSGGDTSNVTTGNATNNNEATFNVNIQNLANIICGPQYNITNPPAGGSGGGQPAPATPAATQVGGRGAGAGEEMVSPVAQQVAAPVGGVGAGTGGLEYLSGVAALTILSGALAGRRIFKTLSVRS